MNTIMKAIEADKDAILSLYRSFLHGAAGWNEDYPSEDTIDYDLSRDALYVMKDDSGEILAAISIDLDEGVEALEVWSSNLAPARELSRLAVRSDLHGQGIAKQMMKHVFGILKEQGNKSVHILVRREHKIAMTSYEHLGYKKVGECTYWGHEYVCMEIEL